jgi:hypothetical protein
MIEREELEKTLLNFNFIDVNKKVEDFLKLAGSQGIPYKPLDLPGNYKMNVQSKKRGKKIEGGGKKNVKNGEKVWKNEDEDEMTDGNIIPTRQFLDPTKKFAFDDDDKNFPVGGEWLGGSSLLTNVTSPNEILNRGTPNMNTPSPTSTAATTTAAIHGFGPMVVPPVGAVDANMARLQSLGYLLRSPQTVPPVPMFPTSLTTAALNQSALKKRMCQPMVMGMPNRYMSCSPHMGGQSFPLMYGNVTPRVPLNVMPIMQVGDNKGSSIPTSYVGPVPGLLSPTPNFYQNSNNLNSMMSLSQLGQGINTLGVNPMSGLTEINNLLLNRFPPAVLLNGYPSLNNQLANQISGFPISSQQPPSQSSSSRGQGQVKQGTAFGYMNG